MAFLTSRDLWWPWRSNSFYSLMRNLEYYLCNEPKFKSVLFLEAEIWKLQNWSKRWLYLYLPTYLCVYLSIVDGTLHNNIQLPISRKLLGQISSNFHSLGRIRVLQFDQVGCQSDRGNIFFWACENCEKSTIFHL